MEIPLTMGVLGLGYSLNKNNYKRDLGLSKSKRYSNNSRTNIYKNNRYNEVKNIERNTVSQAFQKSRDPINNNVIPPQMTSDIFNDNHNSLSYLQRAQHTRTTNQRQSENTFKEGFSGSKPFVSKLTGLPIKKEEFTHNNMVPFFGSKVRQNTDAHGSSQILERHTGMDNFKLNKKERAPLFQPRKNLGNVYGTNNNYDRELERYIPSQKRQTELPFEQIKVGPGLNKGFSSKPTGGFQQMDTRDYVMPKSVDELRVLNNPKLTFKGRVVSGKSNIDKRTMQSKLTKNRPDTFYVNGPERYNTTVGAFTKERKRPCLIVKNTNRKISKEYHGTAQATTNKKNKLRPKIKASDKKTYKGSGPRNLNAPGKWDNEQVGDYGKKAICLPTNERDITGKRTHVSNITSVVKAIIAPVLDVFRTTQKENFIGNIRQTGNVKFQYPSKQTVYDPDDIARTTIKETNIHNNRIGNMNGPKKLMVYDPAEIARTTIKETNIHDNRNGAPNMPTKGIVYDPNDSARTTIKETNIHDNRSGAPNMPQRGTVYDPNDSARTTIKETNIHDNRSGALNMPQRSTVYDPSDIARTTIKETNIHDNRRGYLQAKSKGVVYDKDDVARTTIKETLENKPNSRNISAYSKAITYDPNDIARTTIKETNIHDNRSGQIGGEVKPIVYDPSDIARTTIKETNIHDNRSGNMGSVHGRQGGDGYKVSDVEAPNTNRQFTSDHSYEGIADGQVGKGQGKGYLSSNFEAPNTNKQFTSDHEYTGAAMSGNLAQMSYADIYNATLNEVKEGTLKGRKPTTSNVSLTSGGENINMEIKKIEGDRINSRDLSKTHVFGNIPKANSCQVTSVKDQLDNKTLADRNNPSIIDTFKENPYTKPLDSYA